MGESANMLQLFCTHTDWLPFVSRLKDLERYLLETESIENLHFVVWLKSYYDRCASSLWLDRWTSRADLLLWSTTCFG